MKLFSPFSLCSSMSCCFWSSRTSFTIVKLLLFCEASRHIFHCLNLFLSLRFLLFPQHLELLLVCNLGEILFFCSCGVDYSTCYSSAPSMSDHVVSGLLHMLSDSSILSIALFLHWRSLHLSLPCPCSRQHLLKPIPYLLACAAI